MGTGSHIDWDAHLDAVKGALERTFPGWRITYTATGWWATACTLIREDLSDGDLHAGTAEELHDLLLTRPRRITPTGGGINA